MPEILADQRPFVWKGKRFTRGAIHMVTDEEWEEMQPILEVKGSACLATKENYERVTLAVQYKAERRVAGERGRAAFEEFEKETPDAKEYAKKHAKKRGPGRPRKEPAEGGD